MTQRRSPSPSSTCRAARSTRRVTRVRLALSGIAAFGAAFAAGFLPAPAPLARSPLSTAPSAAQVAAAELEPRMNVAYGTHPRQVLDFYPAKSDKPTPFVFYIHGGGWRNGDKKTNPSAYLAKGISVVAVNYRYTQNGVEEKVEPPVKAPLSDAARALQFVRSKASEWNLDKTRVGATGGSAGGCSSLWLATRRNCASGCRTTLMARTRLDWRISTWSWSNAKRYCRGSKSTRPSSTFRRMIRRSRCSTAARLPLWVLRRKIPRTLA